jgi:hypothetical protein
MIVSLVLVACCSRLSLIYVVRFNVIILLEFVCSSHIRRISSNRSINV